MTPTELATLTLCWFVISCALGLLIGPYLRAIRERYYSD